MSAFDAALARLAGEAGLGECAVIVEELEASPGTGLTGRVASSRPFSPASMMKVPLAAAVYALAEAGRISLERPSAIRAENMTVNDAASPLVPGYACTPRELAGLMLSRSDNVATNELIDLAGREAATGYLHAIGLGRTYIRRKLSGADPLIHDPGSLGTNAHPAEDAALLLGSLAAGSLPGSEPILHALREQVWNDKLSRGWRAGDTFAHKTGDTSEVSHDGGILTTAQGRRYVIVVYTGLPSGADADDRIARFARDLRPLL